VLCRAAAVDAGPEACAVRRDQQVLVRRAVATLPERHQALLGLLVASPPVSYEEISAGLGMPVGSIGPTRARILARLRVELQAAGLQDAALN
jgi:DNA-directed RNA polymerase specialized sigma24 family protein